MINKNRKNINYSKYFIAFLDVLGFKQLVFSKKRNDKKKIEEYFGLIESVTHKLKQIKAKQNLGSIIISDSVILSIPIDNGLENSINKLRQLCIAIGIIQYTLALNNIWLRGAISSGDAYFNPQENAVVGPAYINSYLLESEHAKFPRVIIDHKIIKELDKACAQDLIDEINKRDYGGLHYLNWSSDILFDWKRAPRINFNLPQDVALFIDYFSPLFVDKKRDFKKVLSNIEKSIYTTGVYNKFRWIIDYLLLSCDRLILNNERDDLNLFLEKLRGY